MKTLVLSAVNNTKVIWWQKCRNVRTDEILDLLQKLRIGIQRLNLSGTVCYEENNGRQPVVAKITVQDVARVKRLPNLPDMFTDIGVLERVARKGTCSGQPYFRLLIATRSSFGIMLRGFDLPYDQRRFDRLMKRLLRRKRRAGFASINIEQYTVPTEDGLLRILKINVGV